jgi:hypothetical protein
MSIAEAEQMSLSEFNEWLAFYKIRGEEQDG